MHSSAQNFGANNFAMTTFFGIGVNFYIFVSVWLQLRLLSTDIESEGSTYLICFTTRVAERAVELSI